MWRKDVPASNVHRDTVEVFAQAMHRIRAAYHMYTADPTDVLGGYADALYGLLLAVDEAIATMEGVNDHEFRSDITRRAAELEQEWRGNV